ncbi:glycosyltransferase [Vibrio hippocampi]|uniref:D-inositol-3-phosphate glycosyltransferase n=1 Tax=Vibrio hippocampi TaxID=654686 RepID=A0ABN8DSE3_9VIBR|nr:glycosyltransferase [Vibrio hippocampi]CAH0529964.1 D-inositol-3-phosphate glycosyltransferase [Vibrio hippocampi]
MVNILYAHYGEEWIRGSEQCLLNLLDHIDKRHFQPIVWSNNQVLCQRTEAMQIATHHDTFSLLGYGYRDKASFWQWGKLVTRAVKLIRRHQIGLIHVNSAGPCQWLVFAAKLCQVPLVTQLHSPYILSERFYSGCYASSKIIAVSHAVSHDILADGYPHKQLAVIHNGIAALPASLHSPYWVREQLGLSPETRLFATVGSLIHRKGIDRLINALAQLHRQGEKRHTQGEQLHLLVIGDGPLKKQLQDIAKQQQVDHLVTWAGEQRDVYQWLSGGIDGFVSGAREEAFGLVVAEAALAKLPVIAPNIGGIPEFVAHQHSALLYDDDQGLLQCWSDLLTDFDTLAPTLSANAQQTVAHNLTLDNNANKIERVYHHVLSEPAQNHVKLSRCLLPLKIYLAKRQSSGASHA